IKTMPLSNRITEDDDVDTEEDLSDWRLQLEKRDLERKRFR
ncbi:hypothetical protein AVEN_124175-1, partial [Araneus ventricosus]